ncbi:MAG: transketolase [Telmatospirillum sp.]|nr:transketolase [Telmatospirillum sp.]
MRNVFSAEITRLAQRDPKVILLSGDIGNRLFDRFKDQAPDRFFNCGIAEGNMMGVAAGMALSGFRPVVYTIAPFTTVRCLEQIRVDVCYHNLPVVIVGTGAGLAYAELGATHHSCEDVALLRALPNMTVFCPGDPWELRVGLERSLDLSGPVYIRLGKKGEPDVHPERPALQFGKALTLREGTDVCLITTGTVMPVVMAATERLAEAGVSAQVESFHTVKPLDVERLEDLLLRFPVIAIIEEHSRIGGLGGAIAEWRTYSSHVGMSVGGSLPTLLSFALEDAFVHDRASQADARREAGLTVDNVVAGVTTALANRMRM